MKFSGILELTDEDLAVVAALPGLEMLNLDGTDLTDKALDHVGKAGDLQVLRLQRTRISDRGLVKLQNLRKLKTPILEDTAVTDRGLESLKGLAAWRSWVAVPDGRHRRGAVRIQGDARVSANSTSAVPASPTGARRPARP